MAIVCTRCYLKKTKCHCTDGFANGGAVGALLCRRCVNTRPACECNDHATRRQWSPSRSTSGGTSGGTNGGTNGGTRDKFVLGGGFAAGLCMGCDQTMVCCTCYRGFAGQLNTSLIEWHKKELIVEEEQKNSHTLGDNMQPHTNPEPLPPGNVEVKIIKNPMSPMSPMSAELVAEQIHLEKSESFHLGQERRRSLPRKEKRDTGFTGLDNLPGNKRDREPAKKKRSDPESISASKDGQEAKEAKEEKEGQEGKKEPIKKSIVVTIPQGMRPGNTVNVNLPDGRSIHVVVPKGMRPGNKMTINYNEHGHQVVEDAQKEQKEEKEHKEQKEQKDRPPALGRSTFQSAFRMCESVGQVEIIGAGSHAVDAHYRTTGSLGTPRGTRVLVAYVSPTGYRLNLIKGKTGVKQDKWKILHPAKEQVLYSVSTAVK